jgi:hypothetical protein
MKSAPTMSKFSKPKPDAKTQADIDRVIAGAEAADDRKTTSGGDVRFTMTLPPDMAARIDAARQSACLTRLAWIRLAIAEKLARE